MTFTKFRQIVNLAQIIMILPFRDTFGHFHSNMNVAILNTVLLALKRALNNYF